MSVGVNTFQKSLSSKISSNRVSFALPYICFVSSIHNLKTCFESSVLSTTSKRCFELTLSVLSTASKQCFEHHAASFLVCSLIFIEYKNR
ncbi:hypothetical protein PNI0159_01577 [Streptococcus pneumoniae PNI0159]|nr:hypothetical protein PNI0159_01577 [Streptococcus pneumoniae PNI0159]